MALLHFHYLLTAYGLTVWTHAPAVVLASIWALQAIMYVAGIAVTDLNDYIFWQFLTSLAGVLLGLGHVIVTRVPRLLVFSASYTSNWGQFALWIVFFVCAQLFYAFFPPPGLAWGIVGTVVATIVIQILLWVAMFYNEIVFIRYKGRSYFFLLWLVMDVVMELMFFVAYALSERWTAYISAVTGAAILVFVALVFPLREPYKLAEATAGEPLITTLQNRINGIPLDEDGVFQ